MAYLFALSAIRKNGFLVYKNENTKDLTIRKRNEYASDQDFKEALVAFKNEADAENFVKDNSLANVEVVAIEI